MGDLNPTIAIITLNVNRLNIPIKKHRVSMDEPTICCLQETYFKHEANESNRCKRYTMQTISIRRLGWLHSLQDIECYQKERHS